MNPYFSCKQFKVQHDQSTMKVGTDALLLAALGYMPTSAKNVLEVGCGCGIISLVWKQRFANAIIDAIDIHQASALQSAANFKASPWHKDLHAHALDFRIIPPTANNYYDIILSNPPFFQNDLKPPDSTRKLARHNDSLPFPLLLKGIQQCLSSQGVAHLILPKTEANILIKLSHSFSLYIHSLQYIHPTTDKDYNRIVISMGKTYHAPSSSHFHIRNSSGTYTEEYKKLTSPFLLCF